MIREEYSTALTHPVWHNETARAKLLSSRESEVFVLLAHGSSNRSIARQLQITERTAKAHVARIMTKLGVESRLQAGLVSYAYQLAQRGCPLTRSSGCVCLDADCNSYQKVATY